VIIVRAELMGNHHAGQKGNFVFLSNQ